MFIYLILFACILFLGAKLAPNGEFHDDFLSLKVSKGIQGFCAIAIVAHHTIQQILNVGSDVGLMNSFNYFGYLLVSVFFFFSGYGLYKSYKSKAGYMKGFLKKRLPVVLVPFYLINAIFTVVVLLTGTKYYSDGNPICYGANILPFKITSFLGITLMNSNAWFMVTITVFYIGFYLFFRNAKDENKAIRNMGIFVFAYAIFCMALYCLVMISFSFMSLWFMGEWWYNSSFIFFIGMLFAKNEVKIIAKMKSNYKVLIAVCFVGALVFHHIAVVITSSPTLNAYIPTLSGRGSAFLCYVVQTVSEIFCIGTVLLFTMKIRLNNFILNYLGKYALEIYLIHRLFIMAFHSEGINITNNILYLALIYLCTIISAFILNKIDGAVIKLFMNKKAASNVQQNVQS